ncbi:MAG TPA: Ig domain-containing protein, partial [Myxococcota bacterium]|nr:Ig domain-containing protein [Myxococcota bacterium]
TFRFLTEGLPVGSTNAEYVARLVTANADGPVTFSVDQLPPGVALDPASGFITGRPTSTFNEDITFEASDGVSTIQSTVNLKVNAAGGGGNEGATFANDSLPEGRVGTLYSATLGLENGVGPFVFGAIDLPPGLTLDGLTGQITGIPTAPGTYFAGLSVYDEGEDNKVVTVLPIVVLPAASDFRFTTQFLNNGEVGTPYCDTWLVENAAGAATFGASGLPAGLLLDAATGVVSGTPTVAGTFLVLLSATDGANTLTTNLAIQIAPGPGSSFHWNFFGIPTAIVNVNYDRQPPILVAAEGADAITYSVIGLPLGMSYGATSGELSGTPIEIGEYPLTFTAIDTDTNETLVLSLLFLVLPPNGGDASQIPVNFWVSKESVKVGEPGRDAWRASAIYNADRRLANRFDPLTDVLRLELGARVVELPPGSLEGSDKSLSWRSAKGVTPGEQVKLGPGNQTLSWSTKSDTLTETVPGILTQTVTIGSRGYRLLLTFDERGVFHPALDFERAAFVVRTGKLTVKGPGDDAAKLSLLLADPNFAYEAQTSPLRIRILEGTNVLVDRDFTLLGGEAKVTTDARTGSLVYAFKTLKDAATADRIAKFSYQSGRGTMALALADLDLTSLPPDETHLGVELTVGARTYYTAVTFFEGQQGRWSTTMPGR